MKILKKLFLVFCFSFIFFVSNNRVKAETVYNFNTSNISTLQLYLSNHPDKTENDWKNMILNAINESDLINKSVFENYDNYIIFNDGSINSTAQRVRIFIIGFNNFYLNFPYTNSTQYNLRMNFTDYENYNFYMDFKSNGEFNLIRNDSTFSHSIDSGSMNWNICTRVSSTYRCGYILSTSLQNIDFNSNYTFSIDNVASYNRDTNIPTNFLNGTRYNFIVKDDFSSPEPILYEPQIEYLDGYNKVTYYIDNYSLKSATNGYFVRIVNNTDGTIENIAPDVNNVNQVITKNYYENVSLSIQVHDNQYNILSHYDINTNINYQNNKDYSIRINSVSNEQRIVYYDYLIENNNNVKCYYSINDNNFIEDTNCTDKTNTYFLQLTENGNITWEIRDLQNNVLYNYSQNFVFKVGDPFINFKDNFNNDFLNLDVLINRYEANDVIEYSINNSQFIQVTYLEDYSSTQNIKYFTINNVNNNDLIIVRVKRNDIVVTTAKYRANYLKYSNNSSENFNISNIFNKIDINNINEELKNYIKNFGNLIFSSKIGNLLLLQTLCLVITIIIKMIRN